MEDCPNLGGIPAVLVRMQRPSGGDLGANAGAARVAANPPGGQPRTAAGENQLNAPPKVPSVSAGSVGLESFSSVYSSRSRRLLPISALDSFTSLQPFVLNLCAFEERNKHDSISNLEFVKKADGCAKYA